MAIDAGNAFVSIDTADVSSLVLSINGIPRSREEVDITAMGALIRTMQATLEAREDVTVVFIRNAWNDTLNTKLELMWANPATSYAIAIRPVNAAISATNPEFQFSARLMRYNPFDQAQPGEVYRTTATFTRVTAVTVDITP